jgi:hypothetical protein
VADRTSRVTIQVDMDTGRVKGGTDAVKAYLKSIRDEKVNINLDVDAKNVRAWQKTLKGAEGDILRLQRSLEKEGKALDRRSKLFKSQHPLVQEFINDTWDLIKEVNEGNDAIEGQTGAIQDLTPAYREAKKETAAFASTLQDVTERQRIAAKGNEKAAKVAREEAKAREQLVKQIEKEDAAHRKNLATQERAFKQNEQFNLSLAQLADRHATYADQLDRVSSKSAFLKTPQDIAKMQRLQAEMENVSLAYQRMGGDMSVLEKHSTRSQNTLARLVDQISRVRLHLGFFSLNVKQAAYALTAFGPIISGLIGAFSSLIGVLGTGLVGALGLAGAAMGGFLLNAAGIGFALKPLIKEFTTATGAASDYYEQVIETGKGSEEAQDALKEYQTVLKNLPPETRSAVVEFGKMRASWMKVSEELRKPFFDLMADGMGTLNSLMPMFQRNTVKAFGAASKGVKQWLSGLRGPEAKTIMDTLMTRMTAATPALLSGLGNIVTAFARLSQASSRALPDVMRSFDQWSAGLAKSTDANGFAQRVNTIMDALRAVGRVVTSGTRLLITFFSTGTEAGEGFANTITKTFNRWNSWMKSVAGQQSLKRFFEESVQEMSNLYDIITPLLKIFAKFVQTMRPVSVAFQRIAASALEVVNIMMQIPGVAQLIAAALTGKMLLGIAASVKAVGVGFAALRTRLLGATAASAAFSVSMAQMKVAATGVAASTLPGVGRQAAVTATSMSRLALAGRGLVGMLGGPIGIALTAATVGLMFFGDEISKAIKGGRSFEEILVDQQQALRDNELASAAAANSVKTFNARIKEAEESARAYNKAVAQGASQAQLDELFNDTSTAAGAANKSIEAVAQNIIRYRQTNADLKKANIEAGESFFELGARTGSFLEGILGPTRDIKDVVQDVGTSIGQNFRQQILNGEVGVAEFTRRVRELDNMENFELTPEGRRALHDLRMFKLSDDLRNLNFNRMFMGLERIPDQVGGALNELGRDLPTDNFKNLKGVLSTIVSPRSVQEIVLLGRELQKLKGGYGGRVGTNLLQRILGKVDPNKPEQTIKRLQSAIKRLTGKPVDLKIDVEKDRLGELQSQIRRIQKQIGQGFKGRMQIDNLIATQAKARDLFNRVKDIDALNPSVTVKISPQFTGSWTKQVTLTPKDKTGGGPGGAEGGRFAEGGNVDMQMRRAAPGRKVNRPMFMVGEENRTEFVIATNPAYRQNNLQYWAEAGAALGIPGFARGAIIGGGNAKPTKPKNPGQIGKYEWLKKMISWSETETGNTRGMMEAQLARGAISQLDYPALLSDVTRTEELYRDLNDQLITMSSTAKQRAIKGRNKSRKKPKRDKYPKGESGDKSFDRDMRAWEKNEQKEKDNKQKLRDFYQERLDIGQALDALAIQKMELENERDTGGPLGVSPSVGEAINLLAGGYALQQQFGSNIFGGSASMGGGGSFIAPGGTLPAAPPTENMGAAGFAPRMGGPGAAAAGGKTVTITNNYQEQPADPHTWSKNLAWEVGVA